MAVVVYHIHTARPSAFAAKAPNNHVIRLLLLPNVDGAHGVWVFRNLRWGPGRFYIADFNSGHVVWP